MKKWYTLLFLTGWLLGSLQAQAPNDCPRLYMGSAQAVAGDTVCLDVRADQLSDFLGLQTAMTWDSTQLALVEITDFYLPNLTAQNFNDIANANARGRLVLSWFSGLLQAQTVPDSTVLFTLCFETLPEFGNTTNIRFVAGPATEIIYEGADLNASTISSLINGRISVNGSLPDLRSSCVSTVGTCDGADGAISVTPTGGTPPYAYSWAGPNGYSSSSSAPTELVRGIYSLTLTDSQGGQSTATFEVLPSEGNPLELDVDETCTGDDVVTVTINNINGEALDYTWSTGSTDRGIQTALDMPPNFSYSVTVTSDNGCTQVVQGVTPESCTINNPVNNELIIGSADVPANDTVCVPIDVQVAQDAQRLTIQLSWDGLEADWVEWNTGIPPAFTTSDPGSATITIDTFLGIGSYRVGAACFAILEGADNVITIDGTNSTLQTISQGEVSMTTFPGQLFLPTAPDSGDVILTIRDTVVAGGSELCLPIKVTSQQQLAGMQFALQWDTTNLNFLRVQEWALPSNIEQSFNLDRANEEGELPVLWVDYAGEGEFLVEGATLFEVCFESQVREELTSIELAETVLPSEFVYFDLRTRAAQLNGGRIIAVDQVFPGDTNDDGIVNYRDLANLGHAFGATGPSRDEVTTDFRGYLSMPWEGAFRQKDINHRFADTNGDGVVNHADTIALHANYGKTHGFATPDDLVDAPRKVDGTPLYLQVDTLVPGERVDIPVMLGTENDPVSGIYNVRAIIDYDPAVVVPGSVAFSFNDSWMGTPAEDLLTIYQENSGLGQVAWAISRTDGQDLAGFGRIGTISITIEDVIFSERSDVDEFKILDAHMETAKEEPMPVAPETTTVVIESTSTSTQDILDDGTTSIYPNPVTECLFWTTDRTDIQRIEVRDLQGRPLQTRAFQGNNWITVDGLPAGVYQLHLRTAEGQIVKRFTIAKN